MGPEAAARLLPLIAAESDMAQEQQQQQQVGVHSSPAVAGNTRMHSHTSAGTAPALAASRPMQWNVNNRTHGRTTNGGLAGVSRVRQVYGGGFGKNTRNKHQVLQY